MKTTLKLLATALIAGGTMFAAPRIAIGIGVGGYGPGYYGAPAYATVPPCPGPDYAWVGGYWNPNHAWVNGYWRAPVVNSYRVGPRFVQPNYPRGYSHGYDRNYDRGNDRGRHLEHRFRR